MPDEKHPIDLEALERVLKICGGDENKFKSLLDEWVIQSLKVQNSYQQSLNSQISVNKSIFEEHTKYTGKILTFGYAGFIGIWAYSKDLNIVPDWAYALSGLMILVSLFLYVVSDVLIVQWEAYKILKDKDKTKFIAFHALPTILGFGAVLVFIAFLALYLLFIVVK